MSYIGQHFCFGHCIVLFLVGLIFIGIVSLFFPLLDPEKVAGLSILTVTGKKSPQ